jgi:hypothetical protein
MSADFIQQSRPSENHARTGHAQFRYHLLSRSLGHPPILSEGLDTFVTGACRQGSHRISAICIIINVSLPFRLLPTNGA